MPNTPALVGKGAAAFASGSDATAEDSEFARCLLGSVGLAFEVDEPLIDTVTGISGSGPAYVYTFIEALADGALLEGLPRDQALALATQTVLGAATMVAESGEHPALLRDRVTSPGGTTIAGLAALEEGAFRSTTIKAVKAATEKARELGQ
jgi:pyrroline-5-carboxylate reductase